MACKKGKKRRGLALLLAVLLPVITLAETPIMMSASRVSVTPTIVAEAMSAGDVVTATVMTFANACKTANLYTIIQDVEITDLAAQNANLDVVFFNTAVSGYGASSAAYTPTDASLAYRQTTVNVTTQEAYADNGASRANNLGRLVQCDSAGKIYGVIVSRGTPTYASTADLTVSVSFLQQ